MKTFTARPNFQFSSKHGLYLQQSSYERFSGGVPPAAGVPAMINGGSQFNMTNQTGASFAGIAVGDLLLYSCHTAVGLEKPGPGTDITISLSDDAGHVWNQLGHSFLDTGNYSDAGREAFNSLAGQYTFDYFWTLYNGNPITRIIAVPSVPTFQFNFNGTSNLSIWRPGRVPIVCNMYAFNSGAVGEATSGIYGGTFGTAVPVVPTPVSVNVNRVLIASWLAMNTAFLNGDTTPGMGGVAISTEWYLVQKVPAAVAAGVFTPSLVSGFGNKAPFWLYSVVEF